MSGAEWYKIVDDICGTAFFCVLAIVLGQIVREWIKS